MARAKEFSFSRDRELILWKETFLYNGLRAAGAGIVLGTLMLLTGEPAADALPAFFIWPIGYFIFLLPVGLVAAWLSSIPFVGLFSAFIALLVAVGDPVVFALNKFRPEWVPVDRPSFFSLKLIQFVVFEE